VIGSQTLVPVRRGTSYNSVTDPASENHSIMQSANRAFLFQIASAMAFISGPLIVGLGPSGNW